MTSFHIFALGQGLVIGFFALMDWMAERRRERHAGRDRPA